MLYDTIQYNGSYPLLPLRRSRIRVPRLLWGFLCFFQVVAYDLSPKLVALAQKEAGQSGEGASHTWKLELSNPTGELSTSLASLVGPYEKC